MPSNVIVREGLEALLQKIDNEIAVVEARLHQIAHKLGVENLEELDRLLKTKNLDTSEVDLIRPEYEYLRARLDELRKRRAEVLKMLGRV